MEQLSRVSFSESGAQSSEPSAAWSAAVLAHAPHAMHDLICTLYCISIKLESTSNSKMAAKLYFGVRRRTAQDEVEDLPGSV